MIISFLTHPCKICITRPVCSQVSSKGCQDCKNFLEKMENIIALFSIAMSVSISHLFWFAIFKYTNIIIIILAITLWLMIGLFFGILICHEGFKNNFEDILYLIAICILGVPVFLVVVMATKLENKLMFPSCLEIKNK